MAAAGDLSDPTPTATFENLDATTAFFRALNKLEVYSNNNQVDSTAKMLDHNANEVYDEHHNIHKDEESEQL